MFFLNTPNPYTHCGPSTLHYPTHEHYHCYITLPLGSTHGYLYPTHICRTMEHCYIHYTHIGVVYIPLHTDTFHSGLRLLPTLCLPLRYRAPHLCRYCYPTDIAAFVEKPTTGGLLPYTRYHTVLLRTLPPPSITDLVAIYLANGLSWTNATPTAAPPAHTTPPTVPHPTLRRRWASRCRTCLPHIHAPHTGQDGLHTRCLPTFVPTHTHLPLPVTFGYLHPSPHTHKLPLGYLHTHVTLLHHIVATYITGILVLFIYCPTGWFLMDTPSHPLHLPAVLPLPLPHPRLLHSLDCPTVPISIYLPLPLTWVVDHFLDFLHSWFRQHSMLLQPLL